MPIAGPTPTPTAEARSIEAGMLLIGAGAILLFVSLFLEWYQPGVDAWEIFEVWDLVLALLAVTAFVAVASRLGFGPPRPASWLIGPAAAALVIVLFNIINPPPLTPQIDGDPGTGLWLALAASILMAAGALLSVARISVAFTPADGLAPGPAGPRAAGRFGRGRTAAAPVEPIEPVEPVGPAGPGVPPAPRPGERSVPPTEPTRRL
jgi:hypothetical protein